MAWREEGAWFYRSEASLSLSDRSRRLGTTGNFAQLFHTTVSYHYHPRRTGVLHTSHLQPGEGGEGANFVVPIPT